MEPFHHPGALGGICSVAVPEGTRSNDGKHGTSTTQPMGPRPPQGIGAVMASTEQGETELGFGLA